MFPPLLCLVLLFGLVPCFPLPAPVGVSVWVRKKQYQKMETYEKQKSSKSDDFEDFWYAVRDSNPRPSGP